MVFELLRKTILPKSYNKDKARQEYILNILLVGLISLSLVAFFISLFAQFFHNAIKDATGPQIMFGIFLFFSVLFYLSRKGRIRLSSSLLIFFLCLAGSYTFLKWGADVTQAWLIFALLIIMSGILIGSRFAAFLTLSLIFFLSVLGYLQSANLYKPSISWRTQSFTFGDIFLLNITLVVIALIAWLSNKEMEKSLTRARASERELKKERDLLEIKVEERTKELKQAQLEKVGQLYRFAEIGRLSSSLIHDLMTPLSLISLNLESLKNKPEEKSIETMQSLLKRAIKGTKYLETSVGAFRKQLQNQELKKVFSLQKEIKQVSRMLLYKANSIGVKIILHPSKEITMYGNQLKFSQLMTNLLLNAIDAYEDLENNEEKREIDVQVYDNRNLVMITVRDKGIGILAEHTKKIFQPFFTTKTVEKGTGIGLSISRDIVEKCFKGKISVLSSKKTGTIFTIILPLVKKGEEKNDNRTLVASHK